DQGYRRAEFLRGMRDGDHRVAERGRGRAGDPDLELGEEGEGGDAAGPRGPVHQGMVPNGIQLEGDDLRTASKDFRSDRSANVEHVPGTQAGGHSQRSSRRRRLLLSYGVDEPSRFTRFI